MSMIRRSLPSDVQVDGLTAPSHGPSAIESFSDALMSCAACIHPILRIESQYDAFLVGCFSNHPLITMLREEVTQPVLGIMEASLNAAKCLGSTIGIITTGDRAVGMQDDAIRHYGLEGFYAGSESCKLGVLELESKSKEEVESIMCSVAQRLIAKGADILVLGCAGMTNIRITVQNNVGEDVGVLDGVEHGIHQLIGLVRLGTKTSKARLYKSAAESRASRQQTHV